MRLRVRMLANRVTIIIEAATKTAVQVTWADIEFRRIEMPSK